MARLLPSLTKQIGLKRLHGAIISPDMYLNYHMKPPNSTLIGRDATTGSRGAARRCTTVFQSVDRRDRWARLGRRDRKPNPDWSNCARATRFQPRLGRARNKHPSHPTMGVPTGSAGGDPDDMHGNRIREASVYQSPCIGIIVPTRAYGGTPNRRHVRWP